MSFLLEHWHCILPVAVMVTAMFFMRGKKSDGDRWQDKEE